MNPALLRVGRHRVVHEHAGRIADALGQTRLDVARARAQRARAARAQVAEAQPRLHAAWTNTTKQHNRRYQTPLPSGSAPWWVITHRSELSVPAPLERRLLKRSHACTQPGQTPPNSTIVRSAPGPYRRSGPSGQWRRSRGGARGAIAPTIKIYLGESIFSPPQSFS